MKLALTTSLCLICGLSTFAQAPLKFNYQGVARDAGGTILANQDIGLYLSLHAPVLTGPAIYAETQEVTTNDFGLFNVQFGAGTVVSGTMLGIAWATEDHYLKVELDPTGGTDYVFMGGSQLISVPYALYAESSGTPGTPGPAGPSGADGATGPTGATGPVGPTGAFHLLEDADADTKIQVEESEDEDIIRFDVEGIERWAMVNGRLENRNTGRSVFIGSLAGRDDNLANNWNVAIGHNAFVNNTSGKRNVAVGYGTMNLNISGYGNSAFGRGALMNNTTGNGNVAIGIHALYENTERSGLVAVGDSALYNNGIGGGHPFETIKNTAVGSKALFANETGHDNTAVGYHALQDAKSYKNVAIGSESMEFATGGGANTAVGYQALRVNTNGQVNIAVGYLSLLDNTEGDFNTGVGGLTLYDNTTGRGNTALGYEAMMVNETGNYNTGVGKHALNHNRTGSWNTAVGDASGWMSGTSFEYENSAALGYFTHITGSNMVRLGHSAITSIGGYANWTNISDARFKTDVQEQVPGLAFISKLRPVTYHLDMDAIAAFYNDPDSLRLPESEKLKAAELQIGFIAQEVEAAAKELNFDFHGVEAPQNEQSHYGLRYAEFVPSLVKAVQELSAENQKLSARLDEKDEQIALLLEQMDLLKK